MARIRQLPPDVVAKIAAGEVIERPASVVKELLENSVDAGSTRIEIDIDQGGTELIRVVDDGCGMYADDLVLAFASHATSKLGGADDLFQIGTLGFRGEALSSIGGVAQVRLQSRHADEPTGAEVSCNGGELSAAGPWSGAVGTRIEVRHLFYNTPVRRKFLRTTSTETGHVCETFTRLALAQPNLALALRHNGKKVYGVASSAALRDRIGLFFGPGVSDRLYEVDARQDLVRLHGFIADPSCDRGTAKLQYVFLNGRWIRDRSLAHAVQEAYRGLLMTGRYAVAVLFLEVPPDQVDVNVHPTKSEVRFRDGQAIYHLVFGALRERLRKENLTARLLRPQCASIAAEVGSPADIFPEFTFRRPEPSPPMSAVHEIEPSDETREGSPSTVSPVPSNHTTHLNGHPASAGVLPRAIQLHDAYLVVETPEGMLVIDQHALHERILYEQLKSRVESGTLERQRLLVPEPIDLPAEQSARVLEHRPALAELGLDVEDFGGGTVLLTTYPAMLGKRSPRDVFLSVVDHLMAKDRVPTREHLLNDLLSLMACHAAVKAGDRLSPDDITALIAQRDLADNTHHCPHGRPTSLLFSKQDLDRQFRRT
jgi:DNA mismatch repair protein MutL